MVEIELFFFSSRRRHTRYWRDWSSDVCSSDLAPHLVRDARERYIRLAGRQSEQVVVGQLYGVVCAPNTQRPAVAVYARRGDSGIYKVEVLVRGEERRHPGHVQRRLGDRKSTRLNSSH